MQEAVISQYAREVINPHVSHEGWKEIGTEFEQRWKSKQVCGALDVAALLLLPQNSFLQSQSVA